MKGSLLILTISFFVFVAGVVHASDNVDLTYSIGSKILISGDTKKEMAVAPLIIGQYTMIPFRSIFEELNYVIEWNDADSSITVKKDNKVMKLKIGSKDVEVNGIIQQMQIEPRIIDGRTLVPLRFVAENSGANVVWDDSTKSVYITKNTNYDIGNVLLQEKGKDFNKLIVYDGSKLKDITLQNKDLKNWFNFNGIVLANIFNKETNTNSLYMYSDGEFKELLKNFDVKESFEFSKNLVIHGFDMETKTNKLYRLDGDKKEIKLVADNFYAGKWVIFKGNLLISKYDNKRNYSLVMFLNNTNWEPQLVSEDFIMKESIEDGNYLYIKGAYGTKNEIPFATFDADYNKFQIISEDAKDINLNNIAIINKQIYAIVKGNLCMFSNNSISYAELQDGNNLIWNTAPLNYSTVSIQDRPTKNFPEFTFIKKYKEKLYIGATKGRSTGAYNEYTLLGYSNPILAYTPQNSLEIIDSNFITSNVRVENDLLIMLGKITLKGNDKGQALKIYDGFQATTTLDIKDIKGIAKVGTKIFLNVIDFDRILNKDRMAILVYEMGTITNVITDFNALNINGIGDSLVFYGNDKNVNKNKLFQYKDKFEEIRNNFDINYWQSIDGMIFISGVNMDNMTYQFLKIDYNGISKIKDNLKVSNVVKVKGDYYIVYGSIIDAKSFGSGRKVLGIIDMKTCEYITIQKNIEVLNIMFSQN